MYLRVHVALQARCAYAHVGKSGYLTRYGGAFLCLSGLVFAASRLGQLVGNVREILWDRVRAAFPSLAWRVDDHSEAKVCYVRCVRYIFPYTQAHLHTLAETDTYAPTRDLEPF
jgi:hypothetical protein